MSLEALEIRDNLDAEIGREVSNTRQPTRVGAISPAAEAFCLLVAQGEALNAAYRQTHDVAPDTKPATVNNNAHNLAKRCAPRIAELQAAIAERVVTTAAGLRMRQHAIAYAPALTHTKAFNCRHCYATAPRTFQYDDMGHYAEALEQYEASLKPGAKPCPKPLFGGVGYDHFAPPNPRCRACRGVGERFVYGPTDTTALDPDMAASYRGASVDPRTGVVKIEQADGDAALRELTAMTPGGYAPKQSESKSVSVSLTRVMPAELTAEEAIALYRQQQPVAVIAQQTHITQPPAEDHTP
jgi:hypothetical protein